METSDAFKMGEEAYDRGDGPEMNPYDEWNSQHDEWDDEWNEAAFDEEETPK